MSFTGQLGTSTSMLGSILLGSPGIGGLTQTYGDTLSLDDTMVGVITVFKDTINYIDLLSEHHTLERTLSDTLTYSEFILATGLEDSITYSETMTGAIWKIGNFTDALSATDSLLREIVAHRTIGDTLEFAETFQRHLTRLLAFSDTVTFSEALNQVTSHVFNDSLSFSEALTFFVAKIFKDVLDLADVLHENHVSHRAFADQLVLSDTLSYNSSLHKAISEVLTFNETITGFAVKFLVPETLPLNDTVSGQRSKPINDTLSPTDNFVVNKNLLRQFQDQFNATDQMFENHVIAAHIEETIDFLDTLHGIRARFGTMSDSLSYTDKFFRTHIETLISDTLVITDTFTYHKIGSREVDETLSLNEQLSLIKNYHRSLSDTLLFREGFLVKINYSHPQSVSNTTQPVPAPSGPYVPSVVWEGVTTVLPQVVLTSPNKSIILPAPEFNDYSSTQGKIAVQRGMNGRFRVYGKRTEREKLNWRFVIPKFKADEFEAFLISEINFPMKLIDHNGDHWDVKVLTDSVDFTETGRWSPLGNKVEVTIELVGVKYA